MPAGTLPTRAQADTALSVIVKREIEKQSTTILADIANLRAAIDRSSGGNNINELFGLRTRLDALEQRMPNSGGAGSVDENVVRSICQEMLRQNLTPRTVEVKLPAGVVRQVKGAHVQFEDAYKATRIAPAAGKWPFLHGSPGGGKSYVAGQIADAMGIDFFPISFHSSFQTYSLTGYMNNAGDFIPGFFYDAFKNGGLFFADECGSLKDAGVLTNLNSAISNGWYTFPNRERVKMHKDFRFIGADNTVLRGGTKGFSGRGAQDGSFIDRLAYINWLYDAAIERASCGNDEWLQIVTEIRSAIERVWRDDEPPLFVTPRATRAGFVYIEAGFSIKQTLDMVVWAGSSKSTIGKIKSAMTRSLP